MDDMADLLFPAKEGVPPPAAFVAGYSKVSLLRSTLERMIEEFCETH